jgi:putative salt-induced outer membrane protein YdiY
MRLKDKTIVRAEVSAPEATTQPSAVVADGRNIELDQIKRLGTAQKWTGAILANGNLARGNTHSLNVGVAADASLRRDDETYDDRFSLGAGYNFGKQRGGDGTDVTSTDNFFGLGKYDKFLSDKLYAYGLFRVDHDRIAALNYRLSPGVGVGYQWFESADFNLSTEAGLSYVYEDYITGGSEDRVALRLAYHVDKKLNDKVRVFHNLEWLPGITDPGDYNLNADAGIRSKLTENMFSELKIQYQRDSTPAPGALKNDVRFLLGVGWSF